VYVVPRASGALGVSVAVEDAASYATFAGIACEAPAAVSVKLDAVIVDASIAPAKTALYDASVATSDAPAAGVVEVTPGGAAACAAVSPKALSVSMKTTIAARDRVI
jgi:hypothetical protein